MGNNESRSSAASTAPPPPASGGQGVAATAPTTTSQANAVPATPAATTNAPSSTAPATTTPATNAQPTKPYFFCVNCGHARADPAYQDNIVDDACTYCRYGTTDQDMDNEHKWCVNGVHAAVRQDFVKTGGELRYACRLHDTDDGVANGAVSGSQNSDDTDSSGSSDAPDPPPGPPPGPQPGPPPGPPPRSGAAAFFRGDDVRNAVFRQIGIDDALNLREALHVRDQFNGALRMRDYTTLGNLICEDDDITLHPPRPFFNRDFCARPPWFEPATSTRTRCQNVATWYNPVSRVREPSVCREGSATVAHIPQRHRLVCMPCKTQRLRDTTWRRRALWFPICGTCRTWANANLLANQTDCDCAPSDPWTAGRNGNQARAAHLCREHDQAFWANIADVNNANNRAQVEIDRRRRMTRKTKPKQIGAKRSKKATPLNSLTPRQRRDRMKHSASAWPVGTLYATPRCFCGNRTTFEDDRRPNGKLWESLVAANPVAIRQWRNCVVCREFVNTTH
ncbi:hypothetical protein LTR27_001840 [Elasticomyces elasticus]|nr:hypothetical protein LTR27_001840 [Elasticomyces elasticus]